MYRRGLQRGIRRPALTSRNLHFDASSLMLLQHVLLCFLEACHPEPAPLLSVSAKPASNICRDRV